MMNQIQNNLNQIAQICNQLSQAERNTAQQLQHAAQLCQQVTAQVSQMMSPAGGVQFTGPGQFGTAASPSMTGMGGTMGSSWSNRPVNTNISPNITSGTYGAAGDYVATGTSAFNTNNDLNR